MRKNQKRNNYNYNYNKNNNNNKIIILIYNKIILFKLKINHKYLKKGIK